MMPNDAKNTPTNCFLKMNCQAFSIFPIVWGHFGPTLKKEGLIFVGIDVIGGYLTEINVTSPTGIQEYKRFTGISLSTPLWEAVEAYCE